MKNIEWVFHLKYNFFYFITSDVFVLSAWVGGKYKGILRVYGQRTIRFVCGSVYVFKLAWSFFNRN